MGSLPHHGSIQQSLSHHAAARVEIVLHVEPCLGEEGERAEQHDDQVAQEAEEAREAQHTRKHASHYGEEVTAVEEWKKREPKGGGGQGRGGGRGGGEY